MSGARPSDPTGDSAAPTPPEPAPLTVRALRVLCCVLLLPMAVGVAGVFGRGFQSLRGEPPAPTAVEPSEPITPATNSEGVPNDLAVPPGAVAIGGLGPLPKAEPGPLPKAEPGPLPKAELDVLPSGAEPASEREPPTALLGWNCPQPPAVAAEWVRARMRTLGWRESEAKLPSKAGRSTGQELAAFDRPGRRAWLRIEPRPGGGCRLFWMRLSVDDASPAPLQ